MLRRCVFPSLVALVLFLHGCGFQLRGALDLSQDMSPVYLQQNSVFELGREIKQLLTGNKIQTVEKAELAKVQLTLLNEIKDRRVLSVDTNGRVREYQLYYTINFSIKFSPSSSSETLKLPGIPLGMPSDAQEELPTATLGSVKVSRSLLYDADAVVAVVNESEVLYKDMRRDAARQVLLRLQASARQQSEKTNAEQSVNKPSAAEKE